MCITPYALHHSQAAFALNLSSRHRLRCARARSFRLHSSDELDTSDTSHVKITSHGNLRLKQLLSVITFIAGINIGAVIILVIILSRLYFAITSKNASSKTSPTTHQHASTVKNRSVAKGGSRTALLALWGRSQAYQMNLIGASDSLAPILMSRLSLFGVSSEDDDDRDTTDTEFQFGKMMTIICSRLSVFNHFITGSIFEDQVAYIATLGNTGLVTPMHCRTAWLDSVVDWFADTHINNADGICANVIILGAGYDTRAYRMESLKDSRIIVYEVDAPGTSTEKRRTVRDLDDDTEKANEVGLPVYVECDFETQSWIECLLEERFDLSIPTLVLWEGCTMYLATSTIEETLKIVDGRGRTKRIDNPNTEEGTTTPPWYVAFDYLNPIWARSPVWECAMRFVREPFQSSFTKSEVDELVESVSLDLLVHLSNGDAMSKSLIGRVNNQISTEMVGRYGGFVLARSRDATPVTR
jgi:O-methyltransferase involved in polyketide biosynthesis